MTEAGKRTLLHRIGGEKFVGCPARLVLPSPSALLGRLEAEFVVERVSLLLENFFVVLEPQDLLEREALADEVQNGLDVLDGEDASEDLALETGGRGADETGAVA